MIMNDISHPQNFAISGIESGAASAPTDEPELNIDVANARSFFGKYSAVTLIAAGKLPASPSASTARQARNSHTDVVMPIMPRKPTAFNAEVPTPQPAWRHAPSDQMKIAQRYHFFVPSRSMNLPAKRLQSAYMIENTAVIVP